MRKKKAKTIQVAQVPASIYLTTYMMQLLNLQTVLMNLNYASKNLKNDHQNQLKEVNDNFPLLIKGLNLYNSSQVDERIPTGSLIFTIGNTKLYHYKGKGIPILFIPSHINKAYILDLNDKLSFLKKLKTLGLNPYLLDWEDLKDSEKGYSFEDYLNLRLKPIIEFIVNNEKQPILIAGYCMGGLFSIVSSQLWPQLIKGLITIATPWNFHSKEFLVYPFTIELAKFNHMFTTAFPYISREFIQLMFYYLRFNDVNNKYISFAKSDNITNFIEIEHWANDGINMSTHLFQDCLKNLIIGNKPYNSKWVVNNNLIDLRKIKQQSYCAVALKDKIAPISSTLSLGISLNHCKIKSVNSGHLGMLKKDRYSIAEDLAEWVKMKLKKISPEVKIIALDGVANHLQKKLKVKMIKLEDQNSTDLDKAISYCDSKNSEDIEIINALGGDRLDHLIMNLRSLRNIIKKKFYLEYFKNKSVSIIGKENDDIAVIAFPKAKVSSEGLKYEMKNYNLEFGYKEN
ncbi:polyhydroxyalkanoate synthase [Reticulomyxa filosa]|uniref:Polyhydroxyalkanoate synthase n=1 Tax=Reticulomyxa filosa TaxID=46433 RepID=X6PA37_RETFI|nr:polyhydroxyalkanoate synthase [Reticulomyxa filosa]|eukprot:ETO34914.1 polyhydroxyalkanoate synthase [Reticulomyxa filosa]